VARQQLSFWFVTFLWAVSLFSYGASGYTVVTPVASKEKSVRLAAWRTALAQVLVRQTGNADVGSLPAIQTALKACDRYVARYDYSNDKEAQLYLNTVFSPAGVARLLHAANQTAWVAPARPLLVISSLSVEDSSLRMRAVFKAVTAARGLPLEFASMDLADQSHLASLSGITPEATAWFAERYQTNLLLFVDLARDDFNGVNQPTALQAHLYLDGSPYAWRTAGNTVSTAARELIEQATDTVVRNGTQATSPLMHDWVIDVQGIDSIVAYHEAVAWISHALGITSGLAENLRSNSLQIQFHSSLSRQVLRSRLADGGRLVLLSATAGEALDHLIYSWRAAMVRKQEAPDVA
jgi:hypothetical protein